MITVRDTIKDKQYFLEYIGEEERINKFVTKLKNNQVKTDRIFAVERKIDFIKFGLFVAKYSCGYDIESLKDDFIKLVEDMPKYWDGNSSYIDIVWMMSIGIMYEIEIEKWDMLANLVKKFKIDDWLLNYFIKYKSDKEILISNKFIFKNPYSKLLDIVESHGNQIILIKKYLTQYWYIGHKEMSWHDIHKSKERLYNGYWCFEAGALVKILGLDDSQLKNVPYYPYDLVHYSN